MLNILFLCKNGQVIRSNNLLYMKKSKKNKSQCLRSDGGRVLFRKQVHAGSNWDVVFITCIFW